MLARDCMRSFVSPRALRAGSHVRVIAPSGPFDRESFERGVEHLRARYRVTYRDDLHVSHGFFAGDDARRREELVEAIVEPGVDAIVAARGGWGALRCAHDIDPALIAANPRLLVGFSDITTLHALWARAHVRSVHGAMVGALGRSAQPLVERWIRCVEGECAGSFEGLQVVSRGHGEGVAEGPLVGGNVAVLAAMAGTGCLPSTQDAIVFLEDVGEAPYRLDRALTQLRLAGYFTGARAVLLGQFTECAARTDGVSVHDVLAERLGDLGIPVLSGVPAGHVDDNAELPFGSPTRIDACRGSVSFLESSVAQADGGGRFAAFGSTEPKS